MIRTVTIHNCSWFTVNMSPIFSRNSEADASKFQENIEEMHSLHFDENMISTTSNCVIRLEGVHLFFVRTFFENQHNLFMIHILLSVRWNISRRLKNCFLMTTYRVIYLASPNMWPHNSMLPVVILLCLIWPRHKNVFMYVYYTICIYTPHMCCMFNIETYVQYRDLCSI